MYELRCKSCGKTYDGNSQRWRCECGGLLDLDFIPRFDPGKLEGAPVSMWRYRSALPIDQDENILSFQEGFTPLLPVTYPEGSLLIKQDNLFPSGSYKDRGASVMMSKVKEIGVSRVVEDSSGNAGCAVAAYSALGGIACDIYVPASASAGKLAQIQAYGATLHAIPGTRQDTTDAVVSAAETTYYASHVWNPFFFQGTKTFAYEVAEQLGWKAPDTVIVPAGHGTLLLGTAIGFTELAKAGIVDRIPKIVAVQPEHCAPLAAAFDQGKAQPVEVVPVETLAEGISIARPNRGDTILRYVRESGGKFITVTEEEIRQTLLETALMGHFIEPTTAAIIAGARKYLSDDAKTGEVVVTTFTGHGLKATDKLLKLLPH